MTKAITVRLDDADYSALEEQAVRLQIQPGTLARILVRAGLHDPETGREDTARAALDRLLARSRERSPGDAATLVAEARVALESR